MSTQDALGKRGRALEDDYFRRKDQELLEKMRQEVAAKKTQEALGATTGLTDPALLEELQALGFTLDTVCLLPLVPMLQVAWAEGGVSQAERDLIQQFADNRGIAAGSPADAQLRYSQWPLTSEYDRESFHQPPVRRHRASSSSWV